MFIFQNNKDAFISRPSDIGKDDSDKPPPKPFDINEQVEVDLPKTSDVEEQANRDAISQLRVESVTCFISFSF